MSHNFRYNPINHQSSTLRSAGPRHIAAGHLQSIYSHFHPSWPYKVPVLQRGHLIADSYFHSSPYNIYISQASHGRFLDCRFGLLQMPSPLLPSNNAQNHSGPLFLLKYSRRRESLQNTWEFRPLSSLQPLLLGYYQRYFPPPTQPAAPPLFQGSSPSDELPYRSYIPAAPYTWSDVIPLSARSYSFPLAL